MKLLVNLKITNRVWHEISYNILLILLIMTVSNSNQSDVVLIGAGIMSATLAIFLKELNRHGKPF